jgi:hypothetical protein
LTVLNINILRKKLQISLEKNIIDFNFENIISDLFIEKENNTIKILSNFKVK